MILLGSCGTRVVFSPRSWGGMGSGEHAVLWHAGRPCQDHGLRVMQARPSRHVCRRARDCVKKLSLAS